MSNLARQLIRVELTQRREEGCDTASIEPPVEAALAVEHRPAALFDALYDELDALQPATSFPFDGRLGETVSAARASSSMSRPRAARRPSVRP